MKFKSFLIITLLSVGLQSKDNSMKFCTIIDHLRQLFIDGQTYSYIGEEISQTQHALQAAHLAMQEYLKGEAGQDEVVASLFHDIGHMVLFMNEEFRHFLQSQCNYIVPTDLKDMNGCGVNDHEIIGAQIVKALGFSASVCKIVQSHADAKRYLARDPRYFASISSASKITLEFQGGVMTSDQAVQFEQEPLFNEYIRLRKREEDAKNPEARVPGFDYYLMLIWHHLLAAAGRQ